jgi:hypothetical protein
MRVSTTARVERGRAAVRGRSVIVGGRRAVQLGQRGMTVGGGARGWWSASHGVGWSYSVVWCSGCGRGGRRGAGVAVRGSSVATGMAGVGAVKWRRRKKRVLHSGGWLPL